MLRIRRSSNGEVVFALSGRIDNENVTELESLIRAEEKDRRIVIDLKDVTLAGEGGIVFLAQCEAAKHHARELPAVHTGVDHETKQWKLALLA